MERFAFFSNGLFENIAGQFIRSIFEAAGFEYDVESGSIGEGDLKEKDVGSVGGRSVLRDVSHETDMVGPRLRRLELEHLHPPDRQLLHLPQIHLGLDPPCQKRSRHDILSLAKSQHKVAQFRCEAIDFVDVLIAERLVVAQMGSDERAVRVRIA